MHQDSAVSHNRVHYHVLGHIRCIALGEEGAWLFINIPMSRARLGPCMLLTSASVPSVALKTSMTNATAGTVAAMTSAATIAITNGGWSGRIDEAAAC